MKNYVLYQNVTYEYVYPLVHLKIIVINKPKLWMIQSLKGKKQLCPHELPP